MDIEENEVSLLDLLLVVAENLKLLILGPIVVGLLALAIGYTLPQSFTSQAILALPMPLLGSASTPTSIPTPTPAQASAMMVSPLVLDPVIQSLSLSAGLTIERARAKLANQIKATVGKDGLLRVDVTANTPLEAQKIANVVIDTWLKSTVPGEKDRADLEVRLIQAKVSLESVRRLLERLTGEDSAVLNKPLTLGGANTSIVAVGELQARYQADVLSIPRTLQGLARDVVMQPPTLPTEPVAPKKSLIAILAALGSGFALLLWVFMRQVWRAAALDPQAAEKQAKLRAAIGFKGRSR
ncbi:MAG: hypothetical protein HHJ15_10725 [Rhodoferax sp.]|uniref:Wzz/FepE/Etk N-terminal domain-containing protein n=1 Tax=Rhodoferax sp. TaxID=50421 RepID=UPI00184A3683|nr:Wzz/FepE/Etk N-terminal domain-containing protein [Rhodoferax sp.]NMM20407.1 hypothetical protein [Rhodoferax sp.]